MQVVCLAVTVAAFAFTAAAQSVGVSPTLTGYVHDAALRSLRPIVGIPGSAFVSDAVVHDVDLAWAAPNNDAAIVTRGETTLLFTGLKTLSAHQSEIELAPQASTAVWNAGGKAAAIYSANGESLQLVTIGNAGVYAHPPESIGYLGAITAIAVSPSGAIALSTSDGVYLLKAGSSPELVAKQAAVSLTFYTEERLYASTSDSILQIRLQDNSIQSALTGTAVAVLRASPRMAGLLGIDASSRKVYVFDLDGTLRSELSLDRAPLALTPLQDDSIFVLNGVTEKEPLIVLKASLDPALYFVPAGNLNVP